MPTTEFGGNVILPFVILGLVLTIGYIVWAWSRKSSKGKRRVAEARRPSWEKSALERELQAEIDAVKTAREAEKHREEPALELPEDARQELEKIRELDNKYHEESN